MKKIHVLALGLLFMTGCHEDDNSDTLTTYTVSTSSNVRWEGFLQQGSNYGTFAISSSDIITDDQHVSSGSFSFPISSINVLNLEGELKGALEHHLLSPDFFNVLLYPEVTFEIENVAPYSGEIEGETVPGANYLMKGNLSMLGTTKSISFPAKIIFEGNNLNIDAVLRINRLDWEMNYASDPQGEQYILPEVALDVNLEASR